MFGQGASAVRLISEANNQGIPIYAINAENVDYLLPFIQVSYDLQQDIGNAAASGKTVLISEGAPYHYKYSGIGYIVLDQATGTGAYLISGGANGVILPDCSCERVKKPKTQQIYEIIATHRSHAKGAEAAAP